MKSLLPHYVGSKAPETTTMVAYLSRDIRNGDMDTALRRLQTFLSTIPQCIIRNMKDTISRSFISYSVCWGIMWMWKFVLLVDGRYSTSYEDYIVCDGTEIG